jgi:hypothetical protein
MVTIPKHFPKNPLSGNFPRLCDFLGGAVVPGITSRKLAALRRRCWENTTFRKKYWEKNLLGQNSSAKYCKRRVLEARRHSSYDILLRSRFRLGRYS